MELLHLVILVEKELNQTDSALISAAYGEMLVRTFLFCESMTGEFYVAIFAEDRFKIFVLQIEYIAIVQIFPIVSSTANHGDSLRVKHKNSCVASLYLFVYLQKNCPRLVARNLQCLDRIVLALPADHKYSPTHAHSRVPAPGTDQRRRVLPLVC